MIRILLVDASRLICGLFATVLDNEPDLRVTGYAATTDQGLERIQACDVALVSAALPDDGAYRFVRVARTAHPLVKTVVVGLAEPKSAVIRYIEAGAAGYAYRDDSVDTLLSHIRAAHRAEALLAPDLAAALMARLAEWAGSPQTVWRQALDTAGLTRREREVLHLMEQQFSNRDIAHRLVIEVSTVKNHVHHILTKLDVSSRREIIGHSMPGE
jgi:DNA-binding NarL/FixJ family response regulator